MKMIEMLVEIGAGIEKVASGKQTTFCYPISIGTPGVDEDGPSFDGGTAHVFVVRSDLEKDVREFIASKLDGAGGG